MDYTTLQRLENMGCEITLQRNNASYRSTTPRWRATINLTADGTAIEVTKYAATLDEALDLAAAQFASHGKGLPTALITTSYTRESQQPSRDTGFPEPQF